MRLRLLQLRQMSGEDGHLGSPQAIRDPESMKTQCVWQEETSVDPQAKVIRTGQEASSFTRRRQRGSPEAVTCGWAIFRSQSESLPYSAAPSPSFRIPMGKSPISFRRSLLPRVRFFSLSLHITHMNSMYMWFEMHSPPVTV